jgi:tRNA (guanine-N7-)-methyltransferase
MRKAAGLWRDHGAQAAVARIMPPCPVDYFTVDPLELFGRDAPLELEIGAGRGDFIIERAAATPDGNFLAIERAASIARLLAIRAARRDLVNLRVLPIDARPLVNFILGPGSLGACHVYFPDPWPKERQMKHRLFTPPFARNLARVLCPGAPLYVATDVHDYAGAIFAMLDAAGFVRLADMAPGAAVTGFGRKFLVDGREVYSGCFRAPA